MKSEWKTIRAADFIDFNPRLSIKKGNIATKVAMDKLKPFTKKIPETEKAEFNGGAKFCNGDTVMARITPCLENGKTAYVDMLDDGEIGFGSTEFIVMRAKTIIYTLKPKLSLTTILSILMPSLLDGEKAIS